ncbi:Protein argonaute-2, partial [Taenia solium]
MRYVAIVRQQDQMEEGKTTREEIDGMEGIFSDLLKTYKRHNNSLPDMVIVYRDGVSEGQFERVLRYELEAMKAACRKLDSRPIPITFIVVQKRHHIRFRPLLGNDNVLPGTVIDKEVTHKTDSEFYLCSHEGIKGTSKPAHYHVLRDDNSLSADDLQRFTYGLCHAYMRCWRSVSYPAPTYYSHLAAFRAREWLKDLESAETIMK